MVDCRVHENVKDGMDESSKGGSEGLVAPFHTTDLILL